MNRFFLVLLFASLAGCGGAEVTNLPAGQAYSDNLVIDVESEQESSTVVDYGSDASGLAIGAASKAGAKAHIEGAWSSAFAWPLAPIHAALLPSGSVLTYGGRPDLGENLLAFDIDRWDPTQGFSASAHEFTPSGIDTNVFCSAQSVLSNGNVLISGGDMQPSGGVNKALQFNGVDSTTLYNPQTHMLTDLKSMLYPRWYPSLVTLGNGNNMVIGGRIKRKTDSADQIVATIPEIYNVKNNKWRPLWGARDDTFYKNGWFYPKAFVNTRGTVTVFGSEDKIVEISTKLKGSSKIVGTLSKRKISSPKSAVMYRPGKVMLFSPKGQAHSVNINVKNPKSRLIAQPSGDRFWANTTILADGKMLLVGGARKRQILDTAVHFGEIYDPENDTWTATKESTTKKARLYHSVALLLPDGSVLVAGGGPPGPVVNMNAEIYYPPYLFKSDGSGERAVRPKVRSMGNVAYNKKTNIVMANSSPVSKVIFIRSGSVTHSFNTSQRVIELDFTQSGSVLDVKIPRKRNDAPPGLYMMFIINDKGVPSVAELKMLK